MKKRRRKIKAMKPFKVRPIRSGTDPFDQVRPPKGKTYQWVTVEVMGENYKPIQDQAREAGWKPVPYSRHRKFRKGPKNTIMLNGMMLMERPHQDHWYALGKAAQASLDMVRQHPSQTGDPMQPGYPLGMKAIKATIGPVDAVDMSLEAFQASKSMLNVLPAAWKSDEIAYADVTIRIAVTDKEIRSAMMHRLSPGEYIRRLVIMDTDWLMRVSPSGVDDSVHPIFARGVMRMEPVEKPDADAASR